MVWSMDIERKILDGFRIWAIRSEQIQIRNPDSHDLIQNNSMQIT